MSHNFTSITNNQEKYETYKTQMERFGRARDQGFHLEGIFILYAMLEDRLAAFLYYAGVVNKNRDSLTKNKSVKPHLEFMLSPLGNKKYRLKSIGNKISIIQQIILSTNAMHADDSHKTFPNVLHAQLNKTKGLDEVIPLLNKVLAWCQARNELVHALLNKNLENQEEKLAVMIAEGYQYCRQLDKFVSAFKTRNSIRKQFNIQ